MDNSLTLPCAAGEVSDGYHTFNDLYEHRNMLFVTLLNICSKLPGFLCWKSWLHHDGSTFGVGWFIAGMTLPTGEHITYHLTRGLWDLIRDEIEVELAPGWDGHTADDVINRLVEWIEERNEEKASN